MSRKSGSTDGATVPLLQYAAQDDVYGGAAGGGANNDAFTVYTRRWYILFVFSLLTFQQCFVWITFSPIAKLTEEYYDVSKATISLMLNWGPIVYIFAVIPVVIFSKRRGSARWLVVGGAALGCFGTVLRLLPVWIHMPFPAIYLVHAGQMCNAAVGPIGLCMPPKISATWFPDNERTTATAVGVLANTFGAAIGFFAPYLVTTVDDMPRILYLHFALAATTLTLAAVYFPSKPPSPPSPGALHMDESSLKPFTFADVVKDARAAASNRTFMIVAIFGGGIAGLFNAWTGSLDLLLPRPPYDERSAGWIGFGTSVASVVGGLISGPVADKYFVRRLRLLLSIILFIALAASLWTTLALPLLDFGAVLPHTLLSSATSIIIVGTMRGAMNPLFYELSVELTFPLPELTSSGFLSMANNVWALIFLFVFPLISVHVVNFLLIGGVGATLLATVLLRERYLRLDHEASHRSAKPAV